MIRNVLLWGLVAFLLASCGRQSTHKEIKPIQPFIDVEQSDGKMSKVIESVEILHPQVALTFNGLADEKTMDEILQQLQKYQMKATFFIEGMRLAQEPEVVKRLIQQGHQVEGGTLSTEQVTELNYEETFENLYLTNEIFKKHLNYEPKYIRSRSGDVTKNMRLAAGALGLDGIVTYSINPRDSEMQDAEDIVLYIKRFVTSGAIIHLNTAINPAIVDVIPLLAKEMTQSEYTFSTIDELIENKYTKKELQEIEGHDLIRENLDYEDIRPNVYYRKDTKKKEIALTFDDWASEKRTKEILDVLRHYNIKSTFFLIGKGVEKHPHLARLIANEGHEIASHSYNHQNITKMTPEQLQEDVIKAHEALTYALQEPPLLYLRPAQGVIDKKSLQIIAATGMETIALYDIASFDWKEDFTKEDIYNRVMDRVAPGKVIVMHLLDQTETVEALPLLIEELQGQGYTFEKLSTWIEAENEGSVD